MCFGQEHGLDFQRLLDASTYKEAYRRDMIRWGEEKRQADPGFFCRKIVEGVRQPVWVSGLYGGIEKICFPSLPPLPRYVPLSLSTATSLVQGPAVSHPDSWSSPHTGPYFGYCLL